MKKTIAKMTLTLVISFTASNVWAWYIHCTNGSCVAEKGKLRVYYTEESSSDDCMITGVDGLPFTLSDLARSEKKSNMSMLKNIQKKKSSRGDVSISEPDLGTPGAGITDNRAIATNKQESMGIERSRTRQSGVDYTLAFVIWWANKHKSWKIVHSSICGQYLESVEDLYRRYLDGSIENIYHQWQKERRR